MASASDSTRGDGLMVPVHMYDNASRERDEARVEVARLREALRWIAEYGTRDGDLKDDWAEAMRNIALNTLALRGGDDARP